MAQSPPGLTPGRWRESDLAPPAVRADGDRRRARSRQHSFGDHGLHDPAEGPSPGPEPGSVKQAQITRSRKIFGLTWFFSPARGGVLGGLNSGEHDPLTHGPDGVRQPGRHRRRSGPNPAPLSSISQSHNILT
jgi:hypothetical protein